MVPKLVAKQNPNDDMVNKEVTFAGMSVQMFEIEIEHFTGKEIQEK